MTKIYENTKEKNRKDYLLLLNVIYVAFNNEYLSGSKILVLLGYS